MATFLAHIRVKPGRAAEFEKIAAELYRASHEQEDGLVRYEYWRGADERTYYTLASFPDFNHFLAHQTSDHHEGAAAGLMDVIEAMRFEWVDPIQGASPLVPTDAQPLDPGASDTTARYHERFWAEACDWWLPLR